MKVKAYRTALNQDRQPVLKEAGPAYQIDGRKRFQDPDTIADFLLYDVGLIDAAEEYVYILCLDTKGHLTGLFEATHGTVNCSLFSPREVMQKALLLGAVSIVVTHNHPSGDPTPSADDISATNRIRQAGEIVGVNVIDHIITGSLTGSRYSFMANGI